MSVQPSVCVCTCARTGVKPTVMNASVMCWEGGGLERVRVVCRLKCLLSRLGLQSEPDQLTEVTSQPVILRCVYLKHNMCVTVSGTCQRYSRDSRDLLNVYIVSIISVTVSNFREYFINVKFFIYQGFIKQFGLFVKVKEIKFIFPKLRYFLQYLELSECKLNMHI